MPNEEMLQVGSRTRSAPRRTTRPRPQAVPREEPALTPRAVLALAVWYGLVVGLLELALTFLLKPTYDPSPGLFRLNRHLFWAVPAVDLVLFTLVGVAVGLVRRWRPNQDARVALGPLNLLAFLALLLACRRLNLWAGLILAVGLAIRLTFRPWVRPAALLAVARASTPWLGACSLGIAAVSLGGHFAREPLALSGRLPEPANGLHAPNVLLIVLDTLRADRTSLHGYARETTPNLARLARRGVAFDQARSAAPWTLPSHASILTGRWPHEHRAGIDRPLDRTVPTLASFLLAQGYETGGFVANTIYCGAETGLDRGFATYQDHDLSPEGTLWISALGRRVLCPLVLPQDERAGDNVNEYYRKSAGDIRRDFLAWLDQRPDRPFFAFLNLFDAHTPYHPPAGHARRFGPGPRTARDYTVLSRWFIEDKANLPQESLDLAANSYDDCIAYLDEQLGILFRQLEQRGRLANTLVVVTADHGEHFGEHGLYGHASSLYDQEIHVPLLVLFPGGEHAGRRVAESVSLRDLPATVARVLGFVRSPFPGQPLTRHLNASATARFEPVLAEVDGPVHAPPNLGRSPAFRGPMQALISSDRVYIRSGAGREELYEIAADPAESEDLAGRPALQGELEQFRRQLDRLLSP